MRKKFCLFVICLLFAMTGCSTAEKVDTRSAEQIVNALKESGLPIGNMIVYTEETDTNNLLGRPKQYTSKVNFADTRIDQYSSDNPTGGSVEVFSNADDASARLKYIEKASSGIPVLQQYMYLKTNVLLRIDYDLTPEQAAEYEKAFKEL